MAKKNAYRNRGHKRTPLSPGGTRALRVYNLEAERVANFLDELSDKFFLPTEPESDWRNINSNKSKGGPEAE